MEIPAHRCRFVDYVPSEIRHISFSPASWPKSSYLACARANGDIELWRVREAGIRWHLERTIPGGPSASAEAVAWSHQTEPTQAELRDLMLDDHDEDEAEDVSSNGGQKELEAYKKKLINTAPRLFTAGEDAMITEWNTTTLESKKCVDSNGGAVLCMKVSPSQTQLAVGCADGSIRLFSIIQDRLEYIRSLDRTDKTRILSLAYNHDGSVLIAGGADSFIYRYCIKTSQCTLRMDMDRDTRNNNDEVLVWDVLILRDGTIVSADSNGLVQFREGQFGTVTNSFKAHKADALCLATNAEGNVVFSGSVDRNVIRYIPVETTSHNSSSNRPQPKKWIISGEKRYHSHDVHTIALKTNKPFDILASGGIDTSLIILTDVSMFPRNTPYRTPHFPHRPLISICKKKRWVMAMLQQRILVYRLGAPAQPLIERKSGREERIFGADVGKEISAMSFKRIPLAETSKLIFEVNLMITSNLVSSAISPDGKWMAASDKSKTTLMSIQQDQKTGKYFLKKAHTQTLLLPSYTIAFTPDSNRLILAGFDLCLRIFENNTVQDVDHPNLTWVACGRIDTYHSGTCTGSNDSGSNPDGNVPTSDLTSLIAVSGDGQWFATAELNSIVRVYHFDSMKLDWILPRLPSAATALVFHPVTPTLIVVTSTNDIRMYNIEKKRASDWTKEYSQQIPHQFKKRRDIVTGIGFGIPVDGSQNEPMVLWGPKYVCVVDVEQPIPEPPAQKFKKTRAVSPPSPPQPTQGGVNGDNLNTPKSESTINGFHNHDASSNDDDDGPSPYKSTNGHLNGHSSNSNNSLLSPPHTPQQRPSTVPLTSQSNQFMENFRMTYSLSPLMYLTFLETEVPLPSSDPIEGNVPESLCKDGDDVVMQDTPDLVQLKPSKDVGTMQCLKEMVIIERPELEVLQKLPSAHRMIKYGM
ncbi:hypothetical protein SeMB42_g03132 [Synchytrium endobioticum]|uniref:Uncharacterized protein n=1 Tax=Synchytrium endobioticum TaxID=286115 RepID=A0A507D9J0_9FUNG|nr:hypothetical protein SeLEV6574_g04172 [Synchytrium endobioticum]TPX48121.1 hypothetical protein SeMB42_g03132 [Synchytrium endobioticum]